jgi:hypothetical protein
MGPRTGLDLVQNKNCHYISFEVSMENGVRIALFWVVLRLILLPDTDVSEGCVASISRFEACMFWNRLGYVERKVIIRFKETE